MTATSPRFWNRNGGTASPRSRRRIASAAYLPGWIPPWATPGTGFSGVHGCTAASPSDEDLGVAGDGEVRPDPDPAVAVRLRADRRRPRSARTSTRARPPPTASCGPGSPPRRRGPRPARDARRCGRPSSPCARRRRASRAGGTPTRRPSAGTSAGSGRAPRRAGSGRPGAGSSGSRRGACRSRSRPARPRARRRSGPPPTITNVIHASRRCGTASRSAASNAMRIRRRISVASSIVLSPGANGAHSSCPK